MPLATANGASAHSAPSQTGSAKSVYFQKKRCPEYAREDWRGARWSQVRRATRNLCVFREDVWKTCAKTCVSQRLRGRRDFRKKRSLSILFLLPAASSTRRLRAAADLSSWRTSSLKTHGKAPPTPLCLRGCAWSAAFRALRPAGGKGLASTTEIAPVSPRPVLTDYLRRDVPGQLC